MTWIITGASRGLGRALTRRFAQAGQRVLACARDEARLAALAAEFPGLVRPWALDLADAPSISPRMAEALKSEAHISGLVNNAGIGEYKAFTEHSEAESLAIVQVNFGAVVQLCHAVVPRLQAQKRGHIVNIASDLGRRPLAKMAVYAATKHAMVGLSHSLLRELKGDGIKVSLVNPGIIDTDFGGGAEGSRDASWSLRPEQLADIVWQTVAQPGSVVIDELTVHPLGQDF
jgi:short-subunit dehydrogenase